MKRYKNPLDAIQMFRRLRRRATLIIAGGGELEGEVRCAIQGESNIQYLGRIPEEKKVELYQRAWVVLSTSFIEGWGMIVIEANACGTPVVGYARGSIPEIIQDGVNGFLVPYKDLDAMARRVEYLLDEGVMREFSRASYQTSLKYDWEKTAEQYYEKMREVAES
ncbi:Trehalose synthase [Metallosphaera sp. J1]|nr:Trehalose synthase [Metallosphaera javensis (ex Hofmann et al. 2022)]